MLKTILDSLIGIKGILERVKGAYISIFGKKKRAYKKSKKPRKKRNIDKMNTGEK